MLTITGPLVTLTLTAIPSPLILNPCPPNPPGIEYSHSVVYDNILGVFEGIFAHMMDGTDLLLEDIGFRALGARHPGFTMWAPYGLFRNPGPLWVIDYTTASKI